MKNKIKNIFKSIGIILLLLCFNSVMFSIFNINLKSLSDILLNTIDLSKLMIIAMMILSLK